MSPGGKHTHIRITQNPDGGGKKISELTKNLKSAPELVPPDRAPLFTERSRLSCVPALMFNPRAYNICRRREIPREGSEGGGGKKKKQAGRKEREKKREREGHFLTG